ncbi:hypothetical protein [Dysgonomonas macrotermitis]|uniref:Uncharacterized protein n=1 Tax=Dysgonomonas macrotermitis TaxID=1346286 RepID=A0A1M5ICF8_9BACT|nr:hypothetical protein [Dysgonomonas macrotermitis]SHG26068.1 hypothetical protein SAMN05444362_11935 [Dysgonomonas macrotermitis]
MRQFLLIIFAFTSFLNISAQDRVNKPLPTISDQTLVVLNKALGCYYFESTGQWQEHANNITGVDNFTKLEFRELTYLGKTYLVLLKYYIQGDHRYPTLKLDYREAEYIRFYAMEKEDYLSAIDECGTDCVIRIKPIYSTSMLNAFGPFATFGRFSVDFFDAKKEQKDNMYIQFKKYPEKNIARFIIYTDWKNSRNEYIPMLNKMSDPNNVKLGTEELYTSFYYETTLDSFDKFFYLK